MQRDYRTLSADVFVDQPVKGGDAFTFQADLTKYDGGEYFPALVEQTAILVEAGWYFHTAKVTPFVQYSIRDYKDEAKSDESKMLGGLAYWDAGHKFNLKAAYAILSRDKADDGKQFVLQAQLFAY